VIRVQLRRRRQLGLSSKCGKQPTTANKLICVKIGPARERKLQIREAAGANHAPIIACDSQGTLHADERDIAAAVAAAAIRALFICE